MRKQKLSLLIMMALCCVFVISANALEYSGPIFRQGVNDIVVRDNYAYCATAEGLAIFDIASPNKISPVGEYATPKGAAAISINGNYAYLAAWDSGLDIINISNPRKPILVANYKTGSYANGIFMDGNYAYIAYGYSGLQILDITDPVNPQLTGVFNNSGYAYKVKVENGYAFIYDWTNGIIEIVDIQNPANPQLVNTYKTNSRITDFDINGNRLYIAVKNVGLRINDCTSIGNIKLIDTITDPDIENLANFSDCVLITHRGTNSTIDIIYPTPFSLTFVTSTIDTQDWNKRITIEGNNAFIASCSGLKVINISNPSDPRLTGSYKIGKVSKKLYGLDPYIAMPGATRPTITEFNQDGRDMLIKDDYCYVTGRAGEIDDWQVFLRQTDSTGAQAWEQIYDQLTLYDAAFGIANTSDDGFVLGGKVQVTSGRTTDDILIQKVDADGGMVWHYEYDLDGTAWDGNGFDRLWDVVELDNGDILGCGMITSWDIPFDPLIYPESHKDAGFVKFNSLGEIYWVQNYGNTTSTYDARAFAVTGDNNYVLTGYCGYHYDGNTQLYIAKTDTAGSIIWEQVYGDSTVWHNGYWIAETADGNYVVAGESETDSEIDGLVLKVSADDGEIIWQKSFGDQYYDAFLDGLITSSDEILLAGFKTIDTLGTRIPWIVKIDDDGSYICEINGAASDTSKYLFGLAGPVNNKYILGGNYEDPLALNITNTDLSDCETELYAYLIGDTNMRNASWPPQVIGSDVTYLVNYFRGLQLSCSLNGFYCSADANGDCLVIGSDVTKLVNYFRGLTALGSCANYPTAWESTEDIPEIEPSGWPGCE